LRQRRFDKSRIYSKGSGHEIVEKRYVSIQAERNYDEEGKLLKSRNKELVMYHNTNPEIQATPK